MNNTVIKKEERLDLTPDNSNCGLEMSPFKLLEMAVRSGADIDQLEKLMNLQERHEAKIAKSDFLIAMSKFQNLSPRITKNKEGYGYMYAPLSDIVEQIKEHLFDCGLSYRFEQSHSDKVTITCIVSHVSGHSETNTMTAGADTSGSKNAVQAIGSTVQYLQRYTLIGALGLTTADDDIDGRLPTNCISDQQFAVLDSELNDAEGEFPNFKSKFMKWSGRNSLSEIPADKYEVCLNQLRASLKQRRAKK